MSSRRHRDRDWEPRESPAPKPTPWSHLLAPARLKAPPAEEIHFRGCDDLPEDA